MSSGRGDLRDLRQAPVLHQQPHSAPGHPQGHQRTVRALPSGRGDDQDRHGAQRRGQDLQMRELRDGHINDVVQPLQDISGKSW